MYEKIGNDGEKEGGRVGVDYVEIGEGGKTEIFFLRLGLTCVCNLQIALDYEVNIASKQINR